MFPLHFCVYAPCKFSHFVEHTDGIQAKVLDNIFQRGAHETILAVLVFQYAHALHALQVVEARKAVDARSARKLGTAKELASLD